MTAILQTVRITGTLTPTDTDDTFAVTSEEYNKGGYRSVSTLEERDAITPERRKLGMLVYVMSNNTTYTLEKGISNVDWTVWLGTQNTSCRKYSNMIGDGINTRFTVTHGLSSYDVVTQVQRVATRRVVIVDVEYLTADTVTITFANPPASNAFRVTVVG